MNKIWTISATLIINLLIANISYAQFGSGAPSVAGYQHIGDALSKHYRTNVYLYDRRGHGRSEGKRF